MHVQPRRSLASDGLQNPLKMNGSTRWLTGAMTSIGQFQLVDSRHHDIHGTISEVGKHAARHHTENYFKLQELVCRRHSAALFKAGDLAVAAVPQEHRKLPLGQACSSPQQSDVWLSSVSFRFHQRGQPSFFSIVVRRCIAQQNDRCAEGAT